jgi:hypothetical protein
VREGGGERQDGTSWLEREVECEYRQIRDAALADPFKPFTNEGFERGVEGARTFARNRIGFVRDEVESTRSALRGRLQLTPSRAGRAATSGEHRNAPGPRRADRER